MRTILLTAALITLVAACENPDAMRRAEIARTLEQVTATLTDATIGPAAAGTEAAEARRSTLDKLISTLGSIRDATGGQEAARALLAATAHRELAALDLAEVLVVGSQLSRDRQIVVARLDSARRLVNVADARASLSLDRSEAHLADERARAERRRRDSSEVMAELDGPIGGLTDDNTRDRTEVDRLVAEANRLRREAAEYGGAVGFDRFEQAVDREREADQYEYRVAMREMELEYELQPEHRVALAGYESAEQVIQAIDRSEENLRRYQEAATAEAAAIRERADDEAAEIRTLLESLETEGGDALSAAWASAVEHGEKASAEARKAAAGGRGDEAAAAKMSGARAHELLGRAHWSRAQDAAEQLALTDMLLDAGEVTADLTATLEPRRSALLALRDESIEAARAAYAEAESLAGQVSVRGGQEAIAAFTASVQMAQAGLAGEEMVMPLSLGTGSEDATPAPAATPPAAGGASGHATLIDRLVAMDPADLAGETSTYVRATTPDGRALLAVTTRLQNALMERFGDGAVAAGGPGMGPGAGMGAPRQIRDVRLEVEDESSAVYSYEAAAGQRANMTVRDFGDGWYVEFESLNPQGMATAVAMIPALEDVTGRLEAGEFQSMEEFTAALMQAAMGGAGPAGAAPGGRRPGGRQPSGPGAPGR